MNAQKAGLIFLLSITVLSVLYFYKETMNTRGGFNDSPTFLFQTEYFLVSGEIYNRDIEDPETFAPSSAGFKFPPAYLLPYLLIASPFNNWQDLLGYSYSLTDKLQPFWCLHVVRYLLSLLVLLFLLRPKKSSAFLAHGLIMGLLFAPFFDSISGLIFDNLLLFFVTGILLLYKFGGRWNRYSGWIIGVATMLKIYPGLLFLWALAIRNGLVFVYALPAMATVLAISLLVFGIENHAFYCLKVLPLLLNEDSITHPFNFSIGRFFVIWMVDVDFAMQVFFVFKHALLLLTVIVLWTCKAPAKEDIHATSMRLSLIVCMMLLYLPNYWQNYQLVLLLPVLTLLANAYALDRGWWWQGIMSFSCWILMIALPNHGDGNPYSLPYYRETVEILFQFRRHCALALWICALTWLLQRRSQDKCSA